MILGIALLLPELANIVHTRTLLAAPHAGLAFGPMCIIVGLSFLWPLRFHH